MKTPHALFEILDKNFGGKKMPHGTLISRLFSSRSEEQLTLGLIYNSESYHVYRIFPCVLLWLRLCHSPM